MDIKKLMVLALTVAVSESVLASNGMNLIGYGTRSLSMGGVGKAIVNTNESMMINPAGLANLSKAEFSTALSFMYPDVSHSDNLDNNQNESKDRPPMPFMAYSQPVGHYVLGFGVFVQGGMGAEYTELASPFSVRKAASFLPDPLNTIPGTDTVESAFSHLKLTPTLAYSVSDQLRLGITLNISVAKAGMSLFPNTSVAFDADSSGTVGDSPNDVRFAGMDVDGLDATGQSVSIGVQYQVGDFQFGASYTSKTKLSFDGGTAKMNLSAMGVGIVDYDAELEGISWPQEASVGFAYRVKPWLLLSSDVTWLDWSDAVKDVRITMSNPSFPGAPPQNLLDMTMDWKDQRVFKLGIEMTPIEQWAFRLGYNYGDSPVNKDFLRPLFPVISESHYTAGIGYASQDWNFGLSLEYVPKSSITNNNPDPRANLFGVGSTETLSQKSLTLSIAKRF